MSTTTSDFALKPTTLVIKALPANAILVHANNCIGDWGAGIAADLARQFPAACQVYKKFCHDAKPFPTTRWPPRSLAGRCLIIPPQKADVDAGAPEVYIACLFTSYGYGRGNPSTGKPGRDSQGKILSQTDDSLRAFREQVDELTKAGTLPKDVEIYSPFFNSGAFRVPWEKTSRLIESSFQDWDGQWFILEPPK